MRDTGSRPTCSAGESPILLGPLNGRRLRSDRRLDDGFFSEIVSERFTQSVSGLGAAHPHGKTHELRQRIFDLRFGAERGRLFPSQAHDAKEEAGEHGLHAKHQQHDGGNHLPHRHSRL